MIKVLIIDDEPMQRQGIVRLTPWEDFGAEVIGAAGSGMEGILLAREHRPDVLIVDIKMPGLSGLDVIARLREELDAEYIILSGYSEFEYAQQAIAHISLNRLMMTNFPLRCGSQQIILRSGAFTCTMSALRTWVVPASICQRRSRFAATSSMPFGIWRSIWRSQLPCVRWRKSSASV